MDEGTVDYTVRSKQIEADREGLQRHGTDQRPGPQDAHGVGLTAEGSYSTLFERGGASVRGQL